MNGTHNLIGMRPMHDHGDWTVDTAASGKRWLVCGRCGYREAETQMCDCGHYVEDHDLRSDGREPCEVQDCMCMFVWVNPTITAAEIAERQR